MYLIPTFGNPSGALLSLERRRKVLELAVKYQTLIVEDDPYGDLYFGEAPPPSRSGADQGRARQPRTGRALRQHEQGAEPGPARGLADRRSPNCWRKATMCKQFSDAHTSTFAQATAAQYLKSGRMPDTLAHVRKVYGERAHAMGAGARSANSATRSRSASRSGGLFFWARLTGAGGKIKDASEFAKRAIEHERGLRARRAVLREGAGRWRRCA